MTFKEKVRQAVADYIASEGCSCCEGSDHDAHAAKLAELLDVPMYTDESGYDFYQFTTPKKGITHKERNDE